MILFLATISLELLQKLAAGLLHRDGVPPDRAAVIAHGLVLADIRGIDIHGINCLPVSLARVKADAIALNPSFKFKQVTPEIAPLDGRNTFGIVSATVAIERLLKWPKLLNWYC